MSLSWSCDDKKKYNFFVELGVVVLSLVLCLNKDWVLLNSLSGRHDGGRGRGLAGV